MTERHTTRGGEVPRGLLLTDKHMVFAVMTAAAVAVMVFLFGVFVGRGVLVARPAPPVAQDGGKVGADGPGPASDVAADVGIYDAGPASNTEVPAGVDYRKRIGATAVEEKLDPPADTLRLPEPPPEAVDDTTPKTSLAKAGSPVSGPAAPAAAPAPPPVKEDPGKGAYTVQVSSFRQNQKTEAGRMVESLKRQGFKAYLFEPGRGTNEGFRVRVGTFKSRQEAEVLADRLQKAKYKTWVTRLP